MSKNTLSINEIDQYQLNPDELIFNLKQKFIRETITISVLLFIVIPLVFGIVTFL
jgi:ACR3 family arsenite efflux pump ArsB